MNKVYFVPTTTTDFSEISGIAKRLLEKIIAEEKITLSKHIPIKCHFGEEGNNTFVPASAFNGIIDLLQEKGIESSFIETNALYKGQRMSRQSHIQLAKEHGFNRLPIIIADGQIGEHYFEETINKKHFTKCKIGAEFKNFSQLVVCAHFKGHVVAGFGGAIKQLAMGCAARGGKLEQHSMLRPTVRDKACTACGKCKEVCGPGAISIEKTARIDKEKCVSCAGCIAICPSDAVSFDWNSADFLEKLAEYAFAAKVNKENIYINFLCNITKDCDCMGEAMHPITGNLGVLVSMNPVAIDTASLDLLLADTHSKLKESEINLFKLGRKTLEYGESIGLGNTQYELEIVQM